MSYDLHLFPPEPGVEPGATFLARMEAQEARMVGGDDSRPAPGASARPRHLADALLAVDATLEEWQRDYAAIASRHGITEDEARQRHRDIELNLPEGDLPIQIDIADDSISITFPYGSTGDEADSLIDRVWTYLCAVEAEIGFATYDPQLDRILDLRRDRAEVLRTYTGAGERAAVQAAGRKKPWWRFW